MTDAGNDSLARKTGFYALALNYLPIVHLLAGAGVVWSMPSLPLALTAGLAWLYLLPPLVARMTLLVFGPPLARAATPDSRQFRIWWFLTQMQMIFGRFPLLEEILRLVPGLYSLWLNLWGSKVSLFVFWVPGALVTDRYLLKIGPGVIISSGVGLAGHLSVYDEEKNYITSIDYITIEKGAIIGARAGIGPGCVIGAHELVPAGRLLRPYTHWRGGARAGDGSS